MIRSAFSKALRERVEKVMAERVGQIGAGQIGGDDAATVGMAYRQAVGHIAGLQQALDIADEIDQESNQ